MIEIERKFLVKSDAYKSEAFQRYSIVQGYLNSHPERSVRVRIKGEKGFLTIKGKSNESGMSRFEWEKEIPVEEAKALLSLCEPEIIEKIRYLVSLETHGRASQLSKYGRAPQLSKDSRTSQRTPNARAPQHSKDGRAPQLILEIDEFSGQNAGLVVAEIELNSESEVFTKPAWLGEEVTGQNQYYNASLSKKPFKKW